MNPKLKEKLMESLTAVLPITLIVLALSVVLVPMDVGTAVMFTVGAVLLVFGMGLFQLGAEMAMSPLGEGIGRADGAREENPRDCRHRVCDGGYYHHCRAGFAGACPAGAVHSE